MPDQLVTTGTPSQARRTGRRGQPLPPGCSPAVPVVEAVLGAVDPEILIGHDIHAAETRMIEARHWMQGDGAWPQGGRTDGSRQGGAITSFCLRRDGKLNWSAFGL